MSDTYLIVNTFLTHKFRFMHVKISDNTWKCKSQNELSVQHISVNICCTAPAFGANSFYLATGAAYIREFMLHRFR